MKYEHEYITPCTVCGESVKNVASLQVHILTAHCTQSDTILVLLKNQAQMLISMQQQINNIYVKQTCAGHVSPPHNPPIQAPQKEPPTSPQEAPGAPSYAATVRAQAPQQVRPGAGKLPVKKISFVADSIGHNVLFEELEKITKTKIKRRKAYGSVRAAGQLNPDANFADMVPKEVEENNPEVLVLQRDSITLTDLSPGAPEN